MTALTLPAEAALSWIERHRGQFGVRSHARDDHERVLLLKPLSELALTASLIGREPGLHERCGRLVEWAWDEADRGALLLQLTCARPELIESIGLYAYVHSFGHRNDRLHDWFGHLARSALTAGLEVPAWRWTALRYHLAKLGLADPPERPAAGSWLGALPEPWTISDNTGYPMTHEVFHLTDFGTRPDALAPDTGDYLTLWLPAWWRCVRDSGNHDLAAELVMVGACAGAAAADGACAELLAHHRSDGRFAGPRGAGGDLPCPDGDDVRRQFLRDYHTTLVTLLALTADLWATGSGSGRTVSVPEPAYVPASDWPTRTKVREHE